MMRALNVNVAQYLLTNCLLYCEICCVNEGVLNGCLACVKRALSVIRS